MANDEGALVMMCGRDKEPWPNATACWRIIMACTSYMAMDTRCYSKKQTPRLMMPNSGLCTSGKKWIEMKMKIPICLNNKGNEVIA